jgi:hypothetical protein
MGSKNSQKFLDTFDPQGNMILVSLEKIRIETKHSKNAQEFLDFLVRCADGKI